MLRKYLVAALLALPLMACESHSPSKQDVGTSSGAILGGVVGREVGHGTGQTVATIGCATVGAFLGSKIGGKMDHNDQLKTAQALKTLKNGQSMSWRNPDAGQRYTVMPTRTYEGAACREADGTWRTS
jgi:surface antigen